MTDKDPLKRARTLIKRGRYKKHTIKDPSERFEDVDSIDVMRLDGAEWMPYFDTVKRQIVYGYFEQNNGRRVFHYLSFLAFDYHYAFNSPFEWVDNDSFGFKDL